MLNPNETLQLRRIPLLTPPGRPLEVGWAQEFARWLWHVFVLPAGFGQALAAVDAPLHQAAAAEAGQGTGRVQRPQHPFLGAAPDAHRSTAR